MADDLPALRGGPRLNVVVPYTNLRPETRAVGEAVGATFVDTSGSIDAYWNLLHDLWRRGRSFLLLEHDLVPGEGMLQELWNCPEEWCGNVYPVGRIWGSFFGVTRFRASLIARYPEAVNAMRVHDWDALDAQLISYLHRREPHGPHGHWPAATHLNERSVPPGMVFANCGDCGGPLRFEDLREGPELNRCPRCGRIPSYFQPVVDRPVKRRLDLGKRLIYLGDGKAYLNGVPAADFTTDDAELIDECVASGFYVVVDPKVARRSKLEPAKEPPAPTDVAPVVN